MRSRSRRSASRASARPRSCGIASPARPSTTRSCGRAGEIAFATGDAYLLWRLTGGAVHATDVTNASRTLVFDIAKLAWSDELCELIGVPKQVLPKVVPSSGPIGTTKGVTGMPDGIQIAGIAGDQQSALFGQACFTPGGAGGAGGAGAGGL